MRVMALFCDARGGMASFPNAQRRYNFVPRTSAQAQRRFANHGRSYEYTAMALHSAVMASQFMVEVQRSRYGKGVSMHRAVRQGSQRLGGVGYAPA